MLALLASRVYLPGVLLAVEPPPVLRGEGDNVDRPAGVSLAPPAHQPLQQRTKNKRNTHTHTHTDKTKKQVQRTKRRKGQKTRQEHELNKGSSNG